MIPLYEESTDHIQINERKAGHFPPHLHKSVEIIYVTKGSLVIGTGIDLEEMKEGDFAIVFPNLIHHYQVFQPGENRNITLLASPSYFGTFEEIFQKYRPASPVVHKDQVHQDIIYALQRLKELHPASKAKGLRTARSRARGRNREKSSIQIAALTSSGSGTTRAVSNTGTAVSNGSGKLSVSPAVNPQELVQTRSRYALDHAYIQIILGRSLPVLTLQERGALKDQDIVYQTVAYVSAHYAEDMTQDGMATALGVSPFVLSRVFSKIFHQNFNHYLNEVRLEHVAVLLTETSEPVTDICYDCGFQSQATFNRVFQEKYHMTPREYRRQQGTIQ